MLWRLNSSQRSSTHCLKNQNFRFREEHNVCDPLLKDIVVKLYEGAHVGLIEKLYSGKFGSCLRDSFRYRLLRWLTKRFLRRKESCLHIS
jgi:hypothetical protein